MAIAVHKTGNVVLVDKYAQKTALRLGVSPESVRAEFRKSSRSKAASPIVSDETEVMVESVSESVEPTRPSTTEYWLLKLFLLHEDTVEWIQAHLDPGWIQHQCVRQIVSLRLAAQANGGWQGVAAFLNECEGSEMRSLITEAGTEERAIPNPVQQLGDIALRLRNQFIDRQLAALTHRASQPETMDDERSGLLREQQSLRLLKRQPLVPLGDSADEPF
jgi:hypothetical protein